MDEAAARELLTVIVPCLNEEGNLRETVDAILQVAPSLPVEVEVLLVDDGSTDGTGELMRRIAAERPSCRMRANGRNLGLGRSVLAAYDEIPDHSWVTVFPGDNEFFFDSIRGFLDVRERHDIVLGYLQNPVIRTLVRRFASGSFTHLVNLLYGFSFRYLNGMKLYRAECFKGIDVQGGGHAFNAELLAKAILRNPRLRIGEAPFVARGRALGASKAFRLRSILRAVRDVYIGYRSVVSYRRLIVRPPSASSAG